jgi:hypothetical protein
LELLAAISILIIMTGLLFAAFSQASRGWLLAENRVETFAQARAALDFMAKELSQAIVSDKLQFMGSVDSIAFIAPVNRGPNVVDIMEVVYRPSWKNGAAGPDPTGIFVDLNPPLRLVRRASAFASSNCQSYGNNQPCSGSPCDLAWDFYGCVNWPETSDPNRTAVLAENITSLQFKFYDGTGASYQYWNSTPGTPWGNELPSALPAATAAMTKRAPTGVQITIDLIDSQAAAKIKSGAPITTITNQAMKSFSTFVSIPNRQP